MYGDYKYRFDSTEEGGISSIFLTDSEGEQNDNYPPSTSSNHCCILSNVAAASRLSPMPFMISHSACTNTTTDVKDVDWFHELVGRDDEIVLIEPQKTDQRDATVCGMETDMLENDGADNDGSASSRSDGDETQSFTDRSVVCEDDHYVDWSELASARAALQSSDDASSRCDDDADSWTSDAEEPELLNLMVASSPESSEPKYSEDYEEMPEDGVCDCDDQPEETEQRNNLTDDKNGTCEEVCLSSSTYYIACRDDSRMQTADVDRDSTCSCCHSPLIADQWISDDYRDDEVKSSNDSRLCCDSITDWHWEDVQTQITPREQYSQAAAVPDCDSTLVDEAKSGKRPGENGECNNVTTDMQRQGAGDDAEVEQWQLESTEEESQNTGDCHYQSPTDYVHNCCADCSSGCYDDEISTFYVNYQHQGHTEVDTCDSSPMLTGVQVCGPTSFELLFLIDQLASTACFVEDAGAFMTMLQSAAAPSAASALHVDSSPRIVELRTDDEAEMVTDQQSTHAESSEDADDSLHDDELVDEDTHKTTPTDAREYSPAELLTTSSPLVVCPDKQSELDSECHQNVRRSHKASDDQQGNIAADITSLRRPRVPDVRGNVGSSQLNKDNKMTMTTTAKRSDYTDHAAGGRHLQRRRLPPLDARMSTAAKYDRAGQVSAGLTLDSRPAGDVVVGSQQKQQQQQQQQRQRLAGGGECDKYRLPDVFVDRKPPLPPTAARRRDPSLNRGLRLPAINNAPRIAREPPRVFPAPPQRRRSHPLAPRRPMTPANRNVIASRAVWPSMASGRPVDDAWTRRAALMKRHSRLPPLHQAATVANWQ